MGSSSWRASPYSISMLLVICLLALPVSVMGGELTPTKGSAVEFKETVNLEINPLVAQALPAIDLAHHDAGVRAAIVTSANDGKHGVNSLHPRGLALDLRTRDLTSAQITAVAAALTTRLGPAWDVVIEYAPPHIHVEFDP